MTAEGKVVKTVSGGYNYFGDQNRKLLHPDEFIDVCFSVLKKLTKTLGVNDKVLAVCPCCASGNLILLDENKEPLTPIIGWQTVVGEEDKNAFFILFPAKVSKYKAEIPPPILCPNK